jgi:hypothetical protein
MELHELNQHQELIRIMESLPEFSPIKFWTPEQSAYLKSQKIIWQWLGVKVSYLQILQLGYSPENPINQIQEPFFKKQVDTYGNYLFAILQLIIAGFEDIEQAIASRGREASFRNPRELFAQVCKELSSALILFAINEGINVGCTLSELRSGQSYVGKFYRGSLPQSESKNFCDELEEKGGWLGFSLSAIYSGSSARYLKKSSTPIGYAWGQFRKSQNELRSFLNKEKVRAIKWNCGYPVWADTGETVIFPPELYIS